MKLPFDLRLRRRQAVNDRTNLDEDKTAFWGRLVYRIAVVVSAVVAVLVLITAYYNAERAFPTIPIAGLLVAAIIWGIGWLARKVLAE